MLVVSLPPQPTSARAGSRSSGGALRPAGHDEDTLPAAFPSTSEAETLARPAAHEPSPEERALAEQAAAFNESVRVQSEAEREMNALLALSMEQLKHDDELLKKWIAMI